MSNTIDESLWDSVTVLKKKYRGGTSNIESQKRQGNTETLKKNKNSDINQKMYNLENDSETLKHEKVNLNVGKELQKLRTQKKISQKDLAKELAINVKDIISIENGTSIKNKQLINRITRHLQKK